MIAFESLAMPVAFMSNPLNPENEFLIPSSPEAALGISALASLEMELAIFVTPVPFKSASLRLENLRSPSITPLKPFESNFVAVAHNDYTFKKIKPKTAKEVAEYGYKMSLKGKSLKVVGFKNKITVFLPRFFSHKFVANISATQIKNTK